jgi:hypothetical protein
MKNYFGIVLSLSLLAACNGSDNAVTTSDNAVTTIDKMEDTLQETVVDNEVAVVKQSFPQLFQYLKKQDSTFSEDSFLVAGENKVEPLPPAPIDSARLKPFEKYFIYNSDSSLALDLYSYNYIVTNRNGQPRMEEAGPDSEAAVIDFKNHTRRRVFFGGPATTLWDAKWINLHELLLIGAESHGEENVIPTIWQVNLKDTSIHMFAYQGEVTADMSGYRAQKLGMGF